MGLTQAYLMEMLQCEYIFTTNLLSQQEIDPTLISSAILGLKDIKDMFDLETWLV